VERLVLSEAEDESSAWMRVFDAYAAAMTSDPPDFELAASVRNNLAGKRLLPRLELVDRIVASERMRNWAREELQRVMQFIERVPKKNNQDSTVFVRSTMMSARQPGFFFGKKHEQVY